jgi:hypothetical protein
MRLITLLLTGLLLSTNALAFEYNFKGSISELEDLVINKNGVRLNNFSLGEGKSYSSKSLSNLDVSFSVRNKNGESRHFVLMATGLDSRGKHLWSFNAEPMFSTISGNKTETVNADPYVLTGTLKKTAQVWVKVVGDF